MYTVHLLNNKEKNDIIILKIMNFSDYLLEGKKNFGKKIFIGQNLTYSNLYEKVNINVKRFSMQMLRPASLITLQNTK